MMWVWVGLALAFIGAELTAVLLHRPTLSQTVWRWLHITRARWNVGRILLALFLVWLTLHLLRLW